MEDGAERRKAAYLNNKDMSSNPEEEEADAEEILQSMAGGVKKPGDNGGTDEGQATTVFVNKAKESAKLEDFQIIRMVGKGTFGKVFMV